MGGKARKQQAAAMEAQTALTKEQFEYLKGEHLKQKQVVAEQKAQYEGFEFFNPYADAENFYADMENPYEDMTVDMKAFDFQRQQGELQRANILQSLRGAAGGSGVAGLAQAMANQGALQTQQIAAGISQQERQNQGMRLAASMQLDQMERQGAAQQQQMIMQGDAMVQSAEFGRESTMLASEYGVLTGTGSGMQGAMQNQMSAMGMQAQMYGAQAQGASGMWTSIGSTVATLAKIYFKCVPKGTKIDGINNKINIEDIKPGDMIMGYNGDPVKVLQKHEYLEDPSVKRFYEVEFKNGAKVNVCDMHKINGIAAKDIAENVLNKNVYNGVEYSYDLLTEDLGYRINGVPVNSMILEMAELTAKLKNK